jgi:hypothetical protein
MNSNQGVLFGLSPNDVAHGAALAVLGTGFVAALAVLVAGVLFVRGERRLAAIAFAGAPIVVAAYIGALLLISLMSRNRVIGHGEEKHYCELDCHLAYTVTDVSLVDSLGSGIALAPHGRFCVVTLTARFDPTTTAPWRPHDAPVSPDPRELVLLDDRDRVLNASAEAQRALAQAGAAGASLDLPLLPGASASSRVVFDLPAGYRPQRILLRDREVFHRFALADELSWRHARTYWSFQ